MVNLDPSAPPKLSTGSDPVEGPHGVGAEGRQGVQDGAECDRLLPCGKNGLPASGGMRPIKCTDAQRGALRLETRWSPEQLCNQARAVGFLPFFT